MESRDGKLIYKRMTVGHTGCEGKCVGEDAMGK